PFAPAVARWEAVVLFALLVAVQHGLIWGIWRGQFSAVAPGKFHYDADPLLPVVHCGTLLLMAIVLGSVSLQPEMVRVKALRSGGAGPATPLSGSAAALALSLTAIAAVALFTQCAASMAVAWKAFVIATVNLADFALIFSLLLEFCRLRYRRRALGFVALWLFVLCILPFIMAGVFVNSSFARLSLLAPGAIALADPHSDEINTLFGIVIGHLGVAIVIFLGWKRLWNQLLATARA
ncbi:MAG TPA: hypothetical protein VFV81_08710, partial [Verrucomicrobiae bacterium]|nr:hypothetical protein [Verrucomicrobiae bacterium]